MLTKKEQRLRRSRQTRIRIATQGVARLTVNRTNLHIYATVISGDGSKVLATASTAQADVRASLGGSGKGGNAAAAFSTELPLLLAAQGVAGAGWALLLCSAFGAALAAFAGVLAAPVYQVTPLMGQNLIIVVFAVVNFHGARVDMWLESIIGIR